VHIFTKGDIHSAAWASVAARTAHKPHLNIGFELSKMPFASFYNGVNFTAAYRKIP